MSMTEVTTETEALVRHAFYQQHGITRIATDDHTLQDLTGTDIWEATPQNATLLEEPGSPEWVTRMVRIRNSAVSALANSQRDLYERNRHLEGLGEALLQQAVDREWCEEYDAFAKDWNLPTRVRTYEVTMTVRVEARDEDKALEIVRGCVSTSYTDGITNEPEFEATEEDC